MLFRRAGALLLIVVALLNSAASADTAFTYQGELSENGGLAEGSFNMRFSLWNALSGGGQIGSEIVVNSVEVAGGRFTVELDFGASSFDNSGRWLEIVVDGFTLNLRQPITRSPYSIQTRGIFVDANERVGIGTTAPDVTLHVEGPILSGGSNGGDLQARNPNNQIAGVGLGWVNDVPRIRIGGEGAGTRNGFDIQTVGNRSLLRILNNGYVGIGTTSPNAKLQVVGDGASTVLRVTNGGSGGTAIIAGDVTGTGRAASFYGITSNDLVRIHNDGSGLAAIFVGGVEFSNGVHPAFAYMKSDRNGAVISSSLNITQVTRVSQGVYDVNVQGGFAQTDIFIATCGRERGLVATAHHMQGNALRVEILGAMDNLRQDGEFQIVVYRP